MRSYEEIFGTAYTPKTEVYHYEPLYIIRKKTSPIVNKVQTIEKKQEIKAEGKSGVETKVEETTQPELFPEVVEKGVAVIDDMPEYEVRKTLFGGLKARKIR